jgi:hypothetical protein
MVHPWLLSPDPYTRMRRSVLRRPPTPVFREPWSPIHFVTPYMDLDTPFKHMIQRPDQPDARESVIDFPTSDSSSRNSRQVEESGPFGRNRSIRATSSRTPRARTGTTPVRQKENNAVAEFGRLFAKEQAKEEERRGTTTSESTTTEPRLAPEAVPTECVLYGYAGKQVEWKVLSKYEAIVSPGMICEDYPREDPNLFMSSSSPLGFSRKSVVVHQNLSREAIKKSRTYYGGQHWIKVTFDSYQAAERACFYSPVDIDGHMVHCDMWAGKGPAADVPIPRGATEKADLLQPQLSPRKFDDGRRARTMSQSQSSRFLSGKESAVAGFERALQNQTLPRYHTMPDVQYGQPEDDHSTTASSATATGADLSYPSLSSHQQPHTSSSSQLIPQTPQQNLRSRSIPNLPSQTDILNLPSDSEYMTHLPSVKKAILRPVSEALPPQPTFLERVLRSIPIVSYFVSPTPVTAPSTMISPTTGAVIPITPAKGVVQAATSGVSVRGGRDVIGEGPIVKDDGTWDEKQNGWYWRFWHGVDQWVGTDFCGLKDD